MQRRTFLLNGSLLTGGFALINTFPALAKEVANLHVAPVTDLYELFKDPPAIYRPFVRWWWNGDKVEKEELIRELRLMKEAGIGGVEINPIKFPGKTDDMGKPTVQWLSDEWIQLLPPVFEEAKKLGMTCDLIVGSGWPFGAEYLEGEERSQVVVIGVHKLEGPLDYEVSLFDLFKEADPAVSSIFPGRTMKLLSLTLAPNPLNSLDEVKDLTRAFHTETARFNIPKGKHVLTALVQINGSMEVINGAPGANGPVLNHYNEEAVKKYFNRMSDTIQQKIGPLSKHVRAFFTDSLELEGANWCKDMASAFKSRRGYDLMPYLPFVLFRIAGMGNTYDFKYGVELGSAFNEMIQRMRYDFELTKTELLEERFVAAFIQWCRDNKVLSRVQAYGRGYFPLEGSFNVDLPECETWVKYGLGKEMREDDYRIGRAYTMINKYVSSAAHVKGKKYISAEELTNTDMAFNETLEILKVAADQSVISGVTHPIFHGFNYSPPDAPFPGWVRYGSWFHERNTWWPWFKKFTDYKARVSAVLQQATMFADIAVLPPVADMWSLYSAQNEPFPSLIHPGWQTFIWESIHRNGNACDYVSEPVIRDAQIKDGQLHYGPRKYHTLFLIQVESLEPATAKKLYDFVAAGGRIFCIEAVPVKSVGWNNHRQRDEEVKSWISKMKDFPDRFIRLKQPGENYTVWYRDVQQHYQITPYVKISEPNPFVTQVRYQTENEELLLFINSNVDNSYRLNLSFAKAITNKKQGWIWNAEDGKRYRLDIKENHLQLDLGPADFKMIVFDRNKNGETWKPVPATGINPKRPGTWSVEFRHFDGSVKLGSMDTLADLKELPEHVGFSGTVIYRSNFTVHVPNELTYINLGKVHGVSELWVNGTPCGALWYGRRIYSLAGKLITGNNTLEVKVTTSMGNYLKTLKSNAVAQFWTNELRKNQPIQSMGLIGPVTLYA
jgi:hypothetical protein